MRKLIENTHEGNISGASYDMDFINGALPPMSYFSYGKSYSEKRRIAKRKDNMEAKASKARKNRKRKANAKRK